jgi:cyclic beta-1,2-glucan synthetase
LLIIIGTFCCVKNIYFSEQNINLQNTTSNIFFAGNTGYFLIFLGVFSIIISYLLDILNIIIFKESYIEGEIYADKKFSKDIGVLKKSFIKLFLQIAFLPYEAYENVDAIIRSLFRMKKHKKLLEWVTAEDSEKQAKTDLQSYYREMIANVIAGIVFIILPGIVCKIFGIIWLLGPIFAWYISLDRIEEENISDLEKGYLLEVARKTWNFFESYINEENHYLMIDNYQEDRENKVVRRTSSTNIGLSFIAVISAYDMDFISFSKAKNYIENILNTVNNLAKWNGHLYNWYDTRTMQPLIPRYISTVDSGNFIGYLYILKQFLLQHIDEENLDFLIQNVEALINETDFSVLYSVENKLFSIGFNLEENKLTDSYYDFLASEARQASLVAIAKGDVPSKHWNSLSRTLTSINGYKGLVSWSGTAFEYLMPNINLKSYKGSLLDEASKFAVMCQIKYGNLLDIPWGISESAFCLKDLYNNYQYKAFGIPWLGLKRGLENDIVVSPYSTFLSLGEYKKEAIKNIRKLEKLGAYDKFGFYESIDFTKSRLKKSQKYEVVKTYMAHHQALILLSINNCVNDNILKKRFNLNPEIEATDYLLQERMPINMVLTKENKERINNVKSIIDSGYNQRIIEKHHQIERNLGVIANENYKIMINDLGYGYSKYNGNLIYKFKETSELKQGILFYIKNIKTQEIINPYEDAKVVFAPDKITFTKTIGKLKIKTSITVDPNRPIEIRNVEIENIGNSEEIYEFITELEPVLSLPMQEYSHPAFNKLFLKIENENNIFYITRRNNLGEDELFLGACLYTENEQIVDLEYEIDKEKYYGRNEIDMPIMIKENKKFSNDMREVVDLILAMKKTFKIMPEEKEKISLILMADYDKEKIKNTMKKLLSNMEISRIFDIARVRAEEELQFLQIRGKHLNYYQIMLDYIFGFAPNYKMSLENIHSKNHLWRYGISGDLSIVTVKIRKIEEVRIFKTNTKST